MSSAIIFPASSSSAVFICGHYPSAPARTRGWLRSSSRGSVRLSLRAPGQGNAPAANLHFQRFKPACNSIPHYGTPSPIKRSILVHRPLFRGKPSPWVPVTHLGQSIHRGYAIGSALAQRPIANGMNKTHSENRHNPDSDCARIS
jgi:hypothetical protein